MILTQDRLAYQQQLNAGGFCNQLNEPAERRASLSTNSESDYDSDDQQPVAKGGVACPFPYKLHIMLDAVQEEGLEHIVSWQPHGRAFTVYRPKEFTEDIMPRFFGQTKYASFQRQLNLYGYSRFQHGVDKGAYYHPCFIRGKRSLVRGMIRRKIKGTKVRRTLSADEEPNFYEMEVATVSPSASPVPQVFETKEVQQPQSPVCIMQQVQQTLPCLDESQIPFVPNLFQDVLEDGDLAFFEGVAFHFLEGAEDLDFVDEVPIRPNEVETTSPFVGVSGYGRFTS